MSIQGLARATRTQLSLFALVVAASGCAATVKDVEVHPIFPSKRVPPPPAGKNDVYIEFRDLTASGLEDQVFDGISDAVQDRGWKLAKDYYQANYVLWADLRLFGESGTTEGNEALANLGGVATGVGTGLIVAELTDNWGAGAVAGGGAGFVATPVIKWATREKSYQMVVDLQLGRLIEGGVETELSEVERQNLVSVTLRGTGDDIEGGASGNESRSKQEMREVQVHFALHQRVLAVAEGRRLTKDMARDALVPKLIESLKSQLPRVL